MLPILQTFRRIQENVYKAFYSLHQQLKEDILEVPGDMEILNYMQDITRESGNKKDLFSLGSLNATFSQINIKMP